MYRRRPLRAPLPPLLDRFGIRSAEQVRRDLKTVLVHVWRGDRYRFGLRSTGLFRPDLSLPAYAGLAPAGGRSPIFNFFDRTGGARRWRGAVTRSAQRDWRGGRLSYDEHDGTDFVCPPGTPIVAAAPGVVVATRDTWLRGGLTACVDHGDGVVTQYTHLSSVVAGIGQRVERGEVIAASGVSGLDIAQFFPLIPPHLHFMVWVHGRPVDPYLAEGEGPRAGTWLERNDPRAVGRPLPGDPSPSEISPGVDGAALTAVMATCLDERIRRELEDAPGDAARAAIVEDSLHHDAPAWPAESHGRRVRRPGDPSRVVLTLPLTAELYRDAAAADTPWTRPA
jgi:murein DD-endopeptidase MepM/ murein hydrolase activator NlpD